MKIIRDPSIKTLYKLYASVTLFAINSNYNVLQSNSKSLSALFDLAKHLGDLGSNSPDVVFLLDGS